MTTQFLSRVERDFNLAPPSSNSGPGAFVGGGLTAPKPGFAPFASTSKRPDPADERNQVAPGSYNVSEDFYKKPAVTSVFKSSMQRFPKKSSDDDPGPGNYVLPSDFSRGRPTFAKSAGNHLKLIPTRSPSPPSIPAKAQSHGYEVTAEGTVRPQPSTVPGYSGRPGDQVGPGDYNPKVDVKFRSQPKPIFPKAPDRSALDKILAKVSGAPGPGSYDTPGDFDLNPVGHHLHDSDFLVHLNTAKRRQTSSFESKTNRDAILKDVERRRYDPGPGQYDIPPAIQASTKPVAVQNFNTSGPRFQDGQQRSMRINVPPGKYNPITSDFDQMKIKILRQKKMASRSDWAQHIAFVSTEERFKEKGYDNDVPPPTTYHPKIGLAETLPKPTSNRTGIFGSSQKRFKDEKTVSSNIPKDKLLEMELNREINELFANKPNSSVPASSFQEYYLGQQRSNTSPGPIRPKYNSSNFAPTAENRFRPIKEPPGPPPGAYDVAPKWTKATGVVPMAPPVVICKKKHEELPGPGQYSISRKLGKEPRNPKNIMLSTTKRDPFAVQTEIKPGPGAYQVSTSLVKPSHNILLSDRF